MKIAKRRPKLFWVIAIVTFSIALILLFNFPRQLENIYFIPGLFILSLFLIIPFRNYYLTPDKNPSLPKNLKIVLSKIILAESSLFLIYIHIGITSHISSFYSVLSQHYFYLSIFPWAAISIIALGTAFLSYVKNENTYPSDLLYKVNSPTLALLINNAVRAAILFIIGLVFCFFILFLSNLMNPSTLKILMGFHYLSSFLLLLLLLSLARAGFTRFLYRLLTKAHVRCSTAIIFFTIAGALLFAVLAYFSKIFQGAPNPTPYFFVHLENLGPTYLWLIFSLGFWTASIPLLSIYIASLSYGYTIRAVFFISLIFPLTLLFVLLLLKNSIFSFFIIHPILSKTVFFIAFILFFCLFFSEKQIGPWVDLCVRKKDSLKIRSAHGWLQKILLIGFILLYFYLPIGIGMLSLVAIIFTLPYLLVAFFCSMMIPYRLFFVRLKK